MLQSSLALWRETQYEVPYSHEAHAKEQAQSSSKVGDEGIKSVDVSFLGHINRGLAGPKRKYEMFILESSALWFSLELVLVENARPLAFGHRDNSFVVTPGQVIINSIIRPVTLGLVWVSGHERTHEKLLIMNEKIIDSSFHDHGIAWVACI